MPYLPICYSNHDLRLPEMNWRVSVSVDMFNFADTTPYKVFWQTEPAEVCDTEAKLIKNHQFYDLILTWNNAVLSECPNAKFFAPGSVWTHEADTSQKKFQASYLISSKTGCPGYDFRQEIFSKLPEAKGALRILKHRSPPYLPDKRGMLVPFQYSIIVENAYRPNYFTEKLTDCLATKTIPIYWGCPASDILCCGILKTNPGAYQGVSEFFNTDGILTFTDYLSLKRILAGLTPEYYESKRAVIEENYLLAMKYADRTGNLVKAINDSWTPKITVVHSGEPNVG
jgi:hypothetical protein